MSLALMRMCTHYAHLYVLRVKSEKEKKKRVKITALSVLYTIINTPLAVQ